MLLGCGGMNATRVRFALRLHGALNSLKRSAAMERLACARLATSSHPQNSDTVVTAVNVLAMTGDATELLAQYYASSLHPGDCYLLFGEVGAGKSHFSRAFIRAALRDDSLAVPSPTYVLENSYPLDSPPQLHIHHYDLYRIENAIDLARLELDRSFKSGITLIEWADRLPLEYQPKERLEMRISVMDRRDTSQNKEDTSDSSQGDEEVEDIRWREIEMKGVGNVWRSRLELLEHHIKARGANLGLKIVK